MVTIANESAINERGTHSGPQAGGYIVLPFSTGEVMIADASFEWKVPFPCRLVHVSAHCGATTGGTYSVDTTTGNVVADRTIPTTPEVITPGGTIDLDAVASANRSLAEGDVLTVLFNVGTSITGGLVVVTLYPTGHPTVWLADND